MSTRMTRGIAAVNHNGDIDSTGAFAGNTVSAQVGLSGIPAKYTEKLELRYLIIEVADDLWHRRIRGRIICSLGCRL